MNIANTGLEGKKHDLAFLDEMMEQVGFTRWTWEYHMAIYDYKLEDAKTNSVYYLRVPCQAVSGKLESPYAVLELGEPVMAKHLFPHGLDFDAEIPSTVQHEAEHTLKLLNEKLS